MKRKIDKIYTLYTVERWCYVHHLEFMAIVCRAFIRIVFSCDVPYKMRIGQGTRFPHDALGNVFHPDVVIGKNCKILHGVTLGGRTGHHGLPVIGDNVIIGVHAQVLGNVNIGDNSIIGGSIVLKDVPPNCIVVGNPAKILRYTFNTK